MKEFYTGFNWKHAVFYSLFFYILIILSGLIELVFLFLIKQNTENFYIISMLSFLVLSISSLFIIYRKKQIRLSLNLKKLYRKDVCTTLVISILFVFLSPFIIFGEDYDKYYGVPTLKTLYSFSLSVENITTFLYVVIIVPIIEEIIFKDLILKNILRKTSLFLALIFISLVFSLYHITIDSFLHYFIFSIIASILFLYSGTLLLPIVFHSTVNFLYYIFSSLTYWCMYRVTPLLSLITLFSVSASLCIILFFFIRTHKLAFRYS